MSSSKSHDLSKPGFQFILDDMVANLRQGVNLRAAIDAIVTLGKRVDPALGLESLTPLQAALLELMPEHAVHPTLSTDNHDPVSDDRYYIGVWNYGRIWLSETAPLDPDCRLVGSIVVQPELRSKVAELTQKLAQARSCRDVEMNEFYAGCDNESLMHVLYEVHESLDHVDPVLLYIGEETITNFGKFNNLQARNGANLPDCFFNRVKRMSLDEWTPVERILVFCLYWLRMAGCRGEEFNGRQLYPAAVDAHLDMRLRDYREKAPWLDADGAASIPDKARLLSRYRRDTANHLLTYRWINGLNLYKEERLYERKKLEADAKKMPEDLRRYLAQAYGVDAGLHDSPAGLFEACIARMAESGFACDEPDMNAFEKLLQVIVGSAIDATGSDVGLTRGFRDTLRWQQAFSSQAYDEICTWQPGEHYCAAFPSEALLARLKDKPEALIKMLYACSGRMQFNSWHYTPGHCPRASVPDDRHFYLPPRMPDTAIWSDQHHAGHVHAQVRNTIRCPEPIEIAGRIYPGLVDLRLFRQRGHTYTDDELFLAMRYAGYVRAACQAMVDYQSRTGIAIPVKAFDKDWFRAHFSALCAAAATVTPATDISGLAIADGKPVHAANETDTHPLSQLFRILCRNAQGEEIALVEESHAFPESQLSYRQLVGQVLSLRTTLVRHRVPAGACVTVWSHRPLHQAVAILAGLATSITIHPINPGLPIAMVEGQLRHARPTLLVIDDDVILPAELDDAVLNAATCMRWSEVFPLRAENRASEIAAALAAVNDTGNALAGLLVYTSGTTGEPKCVRLGWHEISANVRHAINALGYQPGWVAGSLLPRFHTFTLISDLLPALFLGGRTVLSETFDMRRIESIVDLFRRHGVQSYSAAPIILEACCGLRAWSRVPSLRFAVAGAAPLKERTRIAYGALFGHPVIPCYGLSETTCFATISPPSDIRPGSVGFPAGIELCAMDDQGTVLPSGMVGELAMRGPSVIRHSYFRDHESRFIKSFHQEGWFLSGDIGHVDADGYVYVTGRKKNMVIRGGEKIYLDDVDRCLFDAPGIIDCASLVQCRPGEPDVAWTFIVSADRKPIPRSEIEAAVRATLTARHVPDRILFIDRIPRTPAGKASHRDLMVLAIEANAHAEVP